MGDEYYFAQALSNFTTNFAYGDAIRHLVDKGYTTEKIIREFQYPLPKDTIDRMVNDHLIDRVAEHFHRNEVQYAYVKSFRDGVIELWMHIAELEHESQIQDMLKRQCGDKITLKERKLHSFNGNELAQLVLEEKEISQFTRKQPDSKQYQNSVYRILEVMFPKYKLAPEHNIEEGQYL